MLSSRGAVRPPACTARPWFSSCPQPKDPAKECRVEAAQAPRQQTLKDCVAAGSAPPVPHSMTEATSVMVSVSPVQVPRGRDTTASCSCAHPESTPHCLRTERAWQPPRTPASSDHRLFGSSGTGPLCARVVPTLHTCASELCAPHPPPTVPHKPVLGEPRLRYPHLQAGDTHASAGFKPS